MVEFAQTLQLETVTIHCTHEGCGIVFSVPARWRDARREDHATFYCPNGHQRWFPPPGTSEVDKLKAQLEREQRAHAHTREQLTSTTNVARKAKAERTRVLRRIAAGVCPHCNRTFANVAEHMQSKHADRLRQLGVPCHPEPPARRKRKG